MFYSMYDSLEFIVDKNLSIYSLIFMPIKHRLKSILQILFTSEPFLYKLTEKNEKYSIKKYFQRWNLKSLYKKDRI